MTRKNLNGSERIPIVRIGSFRNFVTIQTGAQRKGIYQNSTGRREPKLGRLIAWYLLGAYVKLEKIDESEIQAMTHKTTGVTPILAISLNPSLKVSDLIDLEL